MKRYGIIGNPLGHSYSEQYFTELFEREGLDATYHPYAIDEIGKVKDLLLELEGFNVTYPYKESIIPYLTEIDRTAQLIGAVNVVYKGKGYNTDWIGFRDSLQTWVHPSQRALLLGTGGVSKAIQYALNDLGVAYTLVSRNPKNEAIGYNQVDEEIMREHTIIVNCTPLGMHPFENELPDIPYHYLSREHLLYDCIYNPDKSAFLQIGERYGSKIKNGLEMLHLQADEAWKIWKKI